MFPRWTARQISHGFFMLAPTEQSCRARYNHARERGAGERQAADQVRRWQREDRMTDCVFCKIVSGQIPSHRVHEDDVSLAFMDVGQVNPGHVIVAIKPHLETVTDLNPEQAAAMFRAAHRVACAVTKAVAPEGLTILQANGKAGWQTVPHFHLHVLPRHLNDGVSITWPAKNPPAQELAALATRIQAA
jgi:histidine triad (HIT) family protein